MRQARSLLLLRTPFTSVTRLDTELCASLTEELRYEISIYWSPHHGAKGIYQVNVVNIRFKELLDACKRVKSSAMVLSSLIHRKRERAENDWVVFRESKILSSSDIVKTQLVSVTTSCSTMRSCFLESSASWSPNRKACTWLTQALRSATSLRTFWAEAVHFSLYMENFVSVVMTLAATASIPVTDAMTESGSMTRSRPHFCNTANKRLTYI